MQENLVLAGDLKFLTLGDIIQLLGTNGSTGVLKMVSKYAPGPGMIYIDNGNPIHATATSMTGKDALYSLFGWLEGKYSFNEIAVTADRTVKKNRMELLLDALSMLDDGLIEKLGPPEKGAAGKIDKKSGLPLVKGAFIDYMYIVDEEGFYPKSKIVAEGNHGNWMWVILGGEVEIVKKTEDGTIPVLRITDGSFIGSMASFSMQGSSRSATAIAVGEVQLGVLDSQRLSTEYSMMHQKFKEVVISLDNRLRGVTNSVVDITMGKQNPEEKLEGLAPLINQGDTFAQLLKITKGRAVVVKDTKSGRIILNELSEGDFIGSLPFVNFSHEPEEATVYVNEELETEEVQNFQTEELDADLMSKEFEKLSVTMKNILENIADCIAVTTRQAVETKKKM